MGLGCRVWMGVRVCIVPDFIGRFSWTDIARRVLIAWDAGRS